jgi:O-antigen ligase
MPPTDAMRLRGVRGADILLVVLGLGLLGGLYYNGMLEPALIVAAVGGTAVCLAMGVVAPSAALSMSLALPFLGYLPLASILANRTEIIGTLLNFGILLSVVGVRLPSERVSTRRLLFGFGLINAFALFYLPHSDASTSSLALAIVHAVTAAMAIASTALTLPVLARCVGPAGLTVAWAAYSTPQLLNDRTVAAAGQNANGVGMIAALALVLAVVGVFADRRLWRAWHFGVALACSIAVFISQSRGAYLALAIGLLVLMSGKILVRRSLVGWFGIGVFLAAATVLGVQLVAWVGQVTGRFSTSATATESLQTRLDAAQYSAQQGLQHPLYGVGLTNLVDYSSLHDGYAVVRSHVVYLGVWGEVGLLAASLLFVLCWRAVKHARELGPSELAPIAATLVAGISLNWWPSSGTGAVALSILAWGASLTPAAVAEDSPSPTRRLTRSHPRENQVDAAA